MLNFFSEDKLRPSQMAKVLKNSSKKISIRESFLGIIGKNSHDELDNLTHGFSTVN